MVDFPPDMPPDIPALIQQCAPNVAVSTLLSIISVESAKRPHAIGYKVVAPDGSVFRLSSQPKNKAQAKNWASYLMNKGYRFDAGIAQINTVNFARTGLSVETLFDPCSNIRAGAQVLSECYQRAYAKFKNEQSALQAALSCYQSGNFETGFKTGYVAKVLAQANVVSNSDDVPPLVHESGKSSKSGVSPAASADLHNVSSEVPGWSDSPSATVSAEAQTEGFSSDEDKNENSAKVILPSRQF